MTFTSRVGTFVDEKLTTARKFFVTFVTRIWLFASVGSDVKPESFFDCEPFAAFFARVWH